MTRRARRARLSCCLIPAFLLVEALLALPGVTAQGPEAASAETTLGRAPAVAAGGAAGTASWPGFRGERRDGISRETGLLEAWPPGGPRVLWRAGAGAG